MNTSSSPSPASLPLAVVVLAAGKGTRMKSDLPKVLVPLAGKPMVLHVLNAVAPLNPAKTVVVTGHGASLVEDAVRPVCPSAVFVRQNDQLGTAHAVRMAEPVLKDFHGVVLVTYGDAPLIPTEALRALLAEHAAKNAAVAEITTHVANPAGFGRIVRNAQGSYLQTVEEKDCTEAQRAITEVSTCLYAFASPAVWPLLGRIDNNNPKGEYYLTKVMSLALADHLPCTTLCVENPLHLLGANSPEQLAELEAVYNADRAA